MQKHYRFIVLRAEPFENQEAAERFNKELTRMARVGFHDDSISVRTSPTKLIPPYRQPEENPNGSPNLSQE